MTKAKPSWYRRLPRIRRLAAIWAAFIFGTSCTFIERSVFIHFVERFLPRGMPQHLWLGFWSAFGLFVVKAYHMTEFALLCCLLFLVLRQRSGRHSGKTVALAAAVTALYAVSDEWHQTFVPGRGGTWVDVVIDCGGIGLASLVLLKRVKRP